MKTPFFRDQAANLRHAIDAGELAEIHAGTDERGAFVEVTGWAGVTISRADRNVGAALRELADALDPGPVVVANPDPERVAKARRLFEEEIRSRRGETPSYLHPVLEEPCPFCERLNRALDELLEAAADVLSARPVTGDRNKVRVELSRETVEKLRSAVDRGLSLTC